VGFGEPSKFGKVAPGTVEMRLAVGAEQLAERSVQLQDGASYTVLAAPSGDGAALRVYRDGAAKPGTARWRLVHAASEIDETTIELDRKDFGRVAKESASPYRDLDPGDHELTIGPRGDGSAIVSARENFVAGTSATAYLVGSGGEPSRFVLVQDDAATPDQAPATGLGGLGGDERRMPWLAVVLAALAAAIGGSAYMCLRRTRGSGRS